MDSTFEVDSYLAVASTILQPGDCEIPWTLSNTDERRRLVGSQHRLAVPFVLDCEWWETGEGVCDTFSYTVVFALVGGRDRGHVRDCDRHVRAIVHSTGATTRVLDLMDGHCVVAEGQDMRGDLEVVEVGVDQRKMYYVLFARVVMLDVNGQCEWRKSRKLNRNDAILSSNSRVQTVLIHLVGVQERGIWSGVDSLLQNNRRRHVAIPWVIVESISKAVELVLVQTRLVSLQSDSGSRQSSDEPVISLLQLTFSTLGTVAPLVVHSKRRLTDERKLDCILIALTYLLPDEDIILLGDRAGRRQSDFGPLDDRYRELVVGRGDGTKTFTIANALNLVSPNFGDLILRIGTVESEFFCRSIGFEVFDFDEPRLDDDH